MDHRQIIPGNLSSKFSVFKRLKKCFSRTTCRTWHCVKYCVHYLKLFTWKDLEYAESFINTLVYDTVSIFVYIIIIFVFNWLKDERSNVTFGWKTLSSKELLCIKICIVHSCGMEICETQITNTWRFWNIYSLIFYAKFRIKY